MTLNQPNRFFEKNDPPWQHPFVASPHKTLWKLSLPVLLSLVAEPLTGVVDTAFIARLGADSLAALGVSTITLSSLFWIFNFLGIGTQTEVAQALGNGYAARMRRMAAMAVLLSLVFGLLIALIVWPAGPFLAELMGADDIMLFQAVVYLRIRIIGAPAVLVTIAAFGVFRGRQNMHTPLWIAAGINGLNILLDPVLIFGYGPVPALGVGGAALASVVSQWAGALVLLFLLYRHIGLPSGFRFEEAGKLMTIGKDLFIRTGMLTLFLLLATRAATQLGSQAGAAHHAIRQMWTLTALFLDAYAITGQSMVGYFAGAGQLANARKVAGVVCWWSFATGGVLALAMWLGRDVIVALLVPGAAAAPFAVAWLVALLAQPINALAFATDGIHWGMGDFRFLRDVVVSATCSSAGLLYAIRKMGYLSLTWIWVVVGIWIAIRACAGVFRIWPGTAGSPIRGPGGLASSIKADCGSCGS